MKISLTLHCGKAGACVHNFQCGMVVHHRERGAAGKGGAQEHAGHGPTGTDKRLTSWACDIGKQQWMSDREEEERTCLDGPERIWFLGRRPKRQPLDSWCAVRAEFARHRGTGLVLRAVEAIWHAGGVCLLLPQAADAEDLTYMAAAASSLFIAYRDMQRLC